MNLNELLGQDDGRIQFVTVHKDGTILASFNKHPYKPIEITEKQLEQYLPYLVEDEVENHLSSKLEKVYFESIPRSNGLPKWFTKWFLPIFLISFSNIGFSQRPCEDLIQRFEFPVEHSTNGPLVPDPCNALNDYGTERILQISPTPGYQEIKKMVRVTTETIWDPETCHAESKVLSRDTIEISNKRYNSVITATDGGYWTVRMELMVYPPLSRPKGSLATKLPNTNLKDYWVIHRGKFETEKEARLAVKILKEQYPEFCRSFAYFLPEGCQFQYKYE